MNIGKLWLAKLAALVDVLRDPSGFAAIRVVNRVPSNVMPLWASPRMLKIRPSVLWVGAPCLPPACPSESDGAASHLPHPGERAQTTREASAPRPLVTQDPVNKEDSSSTESSSTRRPGDRIMTGAPPAQRPRDDAQRGGIWMQLTRNPADALGSPRMAVQLPPTRQHQKERGACSSQSPGMLAAVRNHVPNGRLLYASRSTDSASHIWKHSPRSYPSTGFKQPGYCGLGDLWGEGSPSP